MMEMSRRRARELALQVLYQIEMNQAGADDALARTIEIMGMENQGDPTFARELVSGVLRNSPELDAVIIRLSKDWRLERMACVDRSILRMGLCEILFGTTGVPHNVAVNEAIELAKKYGSDDSGRFVNGILGKVIEDPALYFSGDDGSD